MDHLLIVDDDRNFANALATTLEGVGYKTTVVYDGQVALDELQQNSGIDLVLLDLDLGDPVLNGRDVCRRIRKLPQPPLVVMLTRYDSTGDIVDGLDCANYYLSRPFKEDVFLAWIKAALRTREDTKRKLLVIDARLRIDVEQQVVTLGDKKIDLTRREFDLLYFLATHRRQRFGRQQLLDAVWGTDFTGTDRNVDRHIFALRSKLEDDPSEPHYILTVHGFGYQFCDW
jgi:DNA-binding response OmpR family regulator